MNNIKDFYSLSGFGNFGVRCLLIKGTETEESPDFQVWGQYGFVWEAGIDKFCVCIHDHRYANRFIQLKSLTYDEVRSGDELIHQFGRSNLHEILDFIKVPKNPESQLRYCAIYHGWEYAGVFS